ncbi:TonB C-terminal domain-containing protein [Campylobacter geochelonis]|uniref:TonB C-terminal domain-containing protein n=1 Tax=Campylobacter geochelonis TaxID=1780362 RepID=UPI000770854C|nr:TonB C-terminal domain-containing protein [Campylobacter geochelonis]CZE50252.1 putative periplasmic protein [Campylobacter geochelonis]
MQTKKVGVNFPELSSLLVAIIIYIFAISALLYTATKSELASVKYTKDKDAYMDIYLQDIDDSPTPIAPQKADIQEKNIDKKAEKPDEEEKLKTTNKKVEEAPKKTEKAKSEDKAKEEKTTLSPLAQKQVDENKTSKKEPEKVVKKEDSLSDLFASIDQDAIKKNEEAVQSRKKSDKVTTGATKKNTSTQNATTKGDEARGKSQRTGVYNKFIGEVDSTLTNIWSTYRALPNQDATVEITIDKNGKLSYTITQLSFSTEFNQKFRDFLSRVERIQFPSPPDGKPYIHRYKMKDLINN